MTAHDPLAVALDLFDVPLPTAGLADRIVATAVANPLSASATRPTPRRDRRGLWRRAGRMAVGIAAVGMVSAAAVASGLLGKVGIEVPVLTAMLAPQPVHIHKPATASSKPAHKVHATVPVPPVATPDPVPPTEFAARREMRIERRERIAAFVENHPRVAAVIARRVGQQLRQREQMRREALGLPPANPASSDFRPLTPEERFILRVERRRDFRRAEAMLDRRIARREAWRAAREPGIASAPDPVPSQ